MFLNFSGQNFVSEADDNRFFQKIMRILFKKAAAPAIDLNTVGK